jgi:hypothetical protein
MDWNLTAYVNGGEGGSEINGGGNKWGREKGIQTVKGEKV